MMSSASKLANQQRPPNPIDSDLKLDQAWDISIFISFLESHCPQLQARPGRQKVLIGIVRLNLVTNNIHYTKLSQFLEILKQ